MSGQSSLMQGKKGLVMGVANDRSIAWGIAKAAADHGATLGFTYQGDALEKRVRPLAESVSSPLVLSCDVTDADSMDAVFAEVQETWGGLDFLVHAIAFSDKEELKGGEVAICLEARRISYVQAQTFCILAILRKQDLDHIIMSFP